MTKKATATRKVKNTKKVIEKLKDVLQNNWGVKKTMKKKRNQLAKMIIAQKEKELQELKKISGIQFKNNSNVRFFEKGNNLARAVENAKETTAKEQKERTGRYVSAKARTRKVLKNEEEMKKYLNKTAKKGVETRAVLERRWKAENDFEEYMEKLRKKMENAKKGKK
jgi:hypothetical protein